MAVEGGFSPIGNQSCLDRASRDITHREDWEDNSDGCSPSADVRYAPRRKRHWLLGCVAHRADRSKRHRLIPLAAEVSGKLGRLVQRVSVQECQDVRRSRTLKSAVRSLVPGAGSSINVKPVLFLFSPPLNLLFIFLPFRFGSPWPQFWFLSSSLRVWDERGANR